MKTFTFALPNWAPHQAGQHVDIRLTAPDGYQAQRSYSIASEPERSGEIDLTVEWIEDGEVSTYLHEVLAIGDRLEMRGPIGGYFVWQADHAPLAAPLLLVAGGSGVVPLMAMLRHRARAGSTVPARLLYSVRSPADIIYADELEKLSHSGNGMEVFYTFTRIQPPNWSGFTRRIDVDMLRDVAAPFGSDMRSFVCGPTLLVETVANGLLQMGVDRQAIRTERFGPSGGPG